MITLRSASETQQIGFDWGQSCTGGEIFLLSGPLGAGKTQLVKGLAWGLNYEGEVTSPTFSLIHEYIGGRLPLYHFDLYRLEEKKSISQLGLEEYISDHSVLVVEWPEKALDLFPDTVRAFKLTILSEGERLLE